MTNSYTVTKKMVMQWVRQSKFRGKRLIMFILWCVLAAMCAAVAAINISLGIFSANTYLLVLLTLFCIYYGFIRDFAVASRQYALLTRTFGGEGWTRTILLNEDNILIKEGTAQIAYNYSEIAAVRDKADMLCITLKNKALLRLYKNSFIGCTAQQCLDMLNAKQAAA